MVWGVSRFDPSGAGGSSVIMCGSGNKLLALFLIMSFGANVFCCTHPTTPLTVSSRRISTICQNADQNTTSTACTRNGCFATVQEAVKAGAKEGRLETFVVVTRTHNISANVVIDFAFRALEIIGCPGAEIVCGQTADVGFDFQAKNVTRNSRVRSEPTNTFALYNVAIRNCARHAVITTAAVRLTEVELLENGSGETEDQDGHEGAAVHTTSDVSICFSRISDNRSPHAGGAIYTPMGIVKIANSTLENNFSKRFGGAVLAGNIFVSGGSLISNNSAYTGGGLYGEDSVNVEGSVLSSNKATVISYNDKISKTDTTYQKGGGIFALRNVTLVDTVLVGNVATAGGGGVHAIMSVVLRNVTARENACLATDCEGPVVDCQGEITVSDSIFTDNVASGEAGALHTITGYIGDSVFKNNSARDGGSVYSSDNITIENCRFLNNNADAGGGIYLENGIVRNCVFFQNGAHNRTLTSNSVGGSIFANGKLEIYDSSIEGGFAVQGAGLLVQGSLKIVNCTVVRCVATQHAGAALSGGDFEVTDSIIAFNVADDCPGIVAEGSMTILNSELSSNGWSPGRSFNGGSVCSKQSINVTSSTFLNNTTNYYGGAIAGGGDVYVSRSVFSNNSATMDQSRGGALMAEGAVVLEDCSFVENSAVQGGAVFSLYSVDVTRTLFRSNSATEGGGFFSMGTAIVRRGNQFTCNRVRMGGGYYVAGSEVRLEGSSIYRSNRAEKSQCSGYAIGNGYICGNSSKSDYCECSWAQTVDTCGDPRAKCRHDETVSDGFRCECVAEGFWGSSMGGCKPCSKCGRGKLVSNCTLAADSVCECPSGYTGPNCDRKCETPPNCIEKDPDTTCKFHSTLNFYGVRCKACEDGYFLDEEGMCVLCSDCGPDVKVVQECTARNDTVCMCPLGKTGVRCKMDCEVPVGCSNVNIESFQHCSFHRSKFDLGVQCTDCKQGYFLTNTTCTPVTECEAGEFQEFQPTPTSDRVCRNCTNPVNCETVESPCRYDKDVVCGECKSGFGGSQCVVAQAVILPENERSDHWLKIVIATTVSAGILFFLLLAVLRCYWKKHAKSHEITIEDQIRNIRRQHKWTEPHTKEAQAEMGAIRSQSGMIGREQFALLDVIGQGQFGTVSRGVVFSNGRAVVCAIKTSRQPDATVRREFLREADVMKRLDHPNIVRILGVCAEGEEEMGHAEWVAKAGRGSVAGVDGSPAVYLLIEYMELGDMRTYLMQNDVTLGMRMWFAFQVAKALAYIAEQGIIHRDIAARNVLLCAGQVNSYPQAKLSDLGLARFVDSEHRQYVKAQAGGELLPVRWMAPEAIFEQVYTEASDAWSYAICVWEIFSNGQIPYDFLQTGAQVVQSVMHGIRLMRPEECPPELWNLLLACWDRDPANRPKFSTIETELEAQFSVFGSVVAIEAEVSSYPSDSCALGGAASVLSRDLLVCGGGKPGVKMSDYAGISDNDVINIDNSPYEQSYGLDQPEPGGAPGPVIGNPQHERKRSVTSMSSSFRKRKLSVTSTRGSTNRVEEKTTGDDDGGLHVDVEDYLAFSTDFGHVIPGQSFDAFEHPHVSKLQSREVIPAKRPSVGISAPIPYDFPQDMVQSGSSNDHETHTTDTCSNPSWSDSGSDGPEIVADGGMHRPIGNEHYLPQKDKIPFAYRAGIGPLVCEPDLNSDDYLVWNRDLIACQAGPSSA